MHRMKMNTPHPVAFTAVSSSALQTRLDASTLTFTTEVIKPNGTAGPGGGTGGISNKGITQPGSVGRCYYTPSAGDLSVFGVSMLVISAPGMEPREIAIDVVAYDPYDGTRAGLTALQPDAVMIGTVVAGALTASSFTTNLTLPTGQLANEAHLRFTSGALAGQVQKITGYAGGVCSFAQPFSTAPTAGDQFVIVNG